ncbi:MAG TPA: radical SAM protein, partial [Turneriella sp.]|nr:radical SAM protein [Turneriella sp.]
MENTKKNSADLTFYIETLGCPKNRADSRRMRTSFLSLGYKEAEKPEMADFFLINSCSFIREAQEETISTVFDALKIKENKSPNMKVGLIGCFVERFSDAVKSDIPELDFTIGTQRYHEVGGLISEKFEITTTGHAALENQKISSNADSQKPFAWLRIAQGCNRHCAFCIIPTIRGPLKPYELTTVEKQLDDEKALRGSEAIPIREVILVSQDTISQGVDAIERIVANLSEKEEVAWIRLQYLFPDRNILRLLKLWEKYPKLTPYLDIPFQHTSPTILKAMKRPSDVGLFTEIIERAHAIHPDFEIRTSFIVGYPGEGVEEFS